MNGTLSNQEFTRRIFFALVLAALAVSGFWIVKPFIPASIWAATIVIATWPLLLQVQRFTGGRHRAVAVLTGALILVFIVPLALGIEFVAKNLQELSAWSKALPALALPPPPGWIASIPIVGQRLLGGWETLANTPHDEIVRRMSPYLATAGRWLLEKIGGAGMIVVHCLLTVVICSLFWTHGEAIGTGVVGFARRLGGPRGQHAVELAGRAVRAVALGLIVTALVQAVLAGVGLAVAGVPYSLMLTAVMFVCGVALIGPLPVLLPSVIWLYWKGDTTWAVVLLVWAVLVSTIDNFLRPAFIRRGANLSLALILVGVLGGVIAFGILGLFIGPVVLAVIQTLLVAWMNGEAAPDATTSNGSPQNERTAEGPS